MVELDSRTQGLVFHFSTHQNKLLKGNPGAVLKSRAQGRDNCFSKTISLSDFEQSPLCTKEGQARRH